MIVSAYGRTRMYNIVLTAIQINIAFVCSNCIGLFNFISLLSMHYCRYTNTNRRIHTQNECNEYQMDGAIHNKINIYLHLDYDLNVQLVSIYLILITYQNVQHNFMLKKKNLFGAHICVCVEIVCLVQLMDISFSYISHVPVALIWEM